MKNYLSVLWVVVALAVNAVAQPAPAPATTNRVAITSALITQLAGEARTNHPAFRAADARVDAAVFNIQTVRQWEDPMAKFGVNQTSPRSFKTSDEGDLTYGVDQKLPLWGKPQLNRRVAVAEAATRRAAVESRVQWLRRDIARALFRLALVERVIEIGEQDLDWLETIIAVAEEKYRAGAATQIDVLVPQNEKGKRVDQLRTERSKLVHERLTLNRLLNRDLHAAWPGFELPSVAAPIPFSPRLTELAIKFEPKLLVMRQEKNQADAATQLARRQRLPDVSVGVEGRQYSGDGGFREGMFTVSLNLPWFNRDRYRSGVRREEAKARAVEADLADRALSVQEEVHHLTVDIDAARREALLYRDEILPRTRQALASARAAWETNRGMVRDVLDARRMLLEGELMTARAVTEQHLMMADLASYCGIGDLKSLQTVSVDSGTTAAPTKP